MEPMLATPATGPAELPRGPEWSYEVKWDGVRALADTTVGPPAAVEPQRAGDHRGVPGAGAGWRRSRARCSTARSCCWPTGSRRSPPSRSACTCATPAAPRRSPRGAGDVPGVRRAAARTASTSPGRTYDERRDTLEPARPARPASQLSPVYPDGQELWEVTKQLGLEGVVAKRRSSTVPARADVHPTGSRPRTAAPARRSSAAGGEETNGSGRLGAVLFGARDADGAPALPRPGGQRADRATATGPAAAAGAAQRTPRSTTRSRPSTRAAPAGCEPTVVVDTLYLARNPTGRLRQPVVRGVRTDTDADPWEQP